VVHIRLGQGHHHLPVQGQIAVRDLILMLGLVPATEITAATATILP